jgi:hypothetical protein
MKKPKAPRLLTVAIFTTITIIFWVFFSVYTVLTTEPPINVPSELLIPISSELDLQALDKLTKRVFIEEGEVPIQPLPPSPIPTPTPTFAEELTEKEESELSRPTEVSTESAGFSTQ